MAKTGRAPRNNVLLYYCHWSCKYRQFVSLDSGPNWLIVVIVHSLLLSFITLLLCTSYNISYKGELSHHLPRPTKTQSFRQSRDRKDKEGQYMYKEIIVQSFGWRGVLRLFLFLRISPPLLVRRWSRRLSMRPSLPHPRIPHTVVVVPLLVIVTPVWREWDALATATKDRKGEQEIDNAGASIHAC